MSRILMVASEAAPFASTGGLSEVLGSLPGALEVLGHEVAVLLPYYRQTASFPMRRIWDELLVELGGKKYLCSVLQAEQDSKYLFLNYPEFYDRDGLYGEQSGEYPDNGLRFALLAKASLEVIRRIFSADIVHCHDWQAGLLPLFLQARNYDPTFLSIKTLFTIHNLGYRGLFPTRILPEIGIPATYLHHEGVEFWNQVSYLKSGIVYSDALNTVSRTYAKEIQTPEHGFGLDGLLHSRRNILSGILNGADYGTWNPASDRYIPAKFSADNLPGKQVCKRLLLQEFGLPAHALGKPLMGVISRLTKQKGLQLFSAISPELFQKEDVYLVMIGDGNGEGEQMFRQLAAAFPGRVSVQIGYNNGVAHRIEAGADLFLMPSLYEPCGLNQIYSLKYGTVPVVRATGGLVDTVTEETGFLFKEATGEALFAVIRSALAAYRNANRWRTIQKAGMAQDFSWQAAAGEYAQLYNSLLNPSEV